MNKNGRLFISILEHHDLIPSVWDPHIYKSPGEGKQLIDYAKVRNVKTRKRFPEPDLFHTIFKFAPIEYKHVPKTHHITFTFGEIEGGKNITTNDFAEEQELLFGTMRAYLGNVIVTPKAEWIGCQSPLYFPIKSEFVSVYPHDELFYFWWAYMKTEDFLRNLPLGTGGTRPRLSNEGLEVTPVYIPKEEVRQEINYKLEKIAERAWKDYMEQKNLFSIISHS